MLMKHGHSCTAWSWLFIGKAYSSPATTTAVLPCTCVQLKRREAGDQQRSQEVLSRELTVAARAAELDRREVDVEAASKAIAAMEAAAVAAQAAAELAGGEASSKQEAAAAAAVAAEEGRQRLEVQAARLAAERVAWEAEQVSVAAERVAIKEEQAQLEVGNQPCAQMEGNTWWPSTTVRACTCC